MGGVPQRANPTDVEFGTTIASRILFEAAADENVLPVFSNIVFMAAAVPVREYLVSVIPYLMLHEDTQMFHLTLHDRAERAERHPSGGEPLDSTTPGSLLVWIDRFFESPARPTKKIPRASIASGSSGSPHVERRGVSEHALVV